MRNMSGQGPGTGLVTFVGAGPGDPELLTIKGQKAIAAADLVLFAGSLVPRAVIACARNDARIVDSAPLTLEECHALMRDTARAGGTVARVHTGDPALYGALGEQTALLDKDGIPWRVIPGVTAAFAAAAAAKLSLSAPASRQSLILCRHAGRTPVPPGQSLRELARHHAAMAVYLSAQAAGQIARELEESLPGETPILCAHRVGWPEERLVWTSLERLAACVEENGFDRQTVFLILPAAESDGEARSRLYDPEFRHGHRP